MAKGLWQPPRLRVGQDLEEERRATWLELFYDLVFVVAIAEVAHKLHGEVSLLGFVSFVALFVPIWLCWLGATFYATRFDTDDLGHRLLTLLQMALIAALAVNVHHGLRSLRLVLLSATQPFVVFSLSSTSLLDTMCHQHVP
jgi:low temperature requirement protein LtrA